MWNTEMYFKTFFLGKKAKMNNNVILYSENCTEIELEIVVKARSITHLSKINLPFETDNYIHFIPDF